MFSNKGQIINMIVAVATFLFLLWALPQKGMTPRDASIIFDILFFIMAGCIWAWVRGSDERALEINSRRISALEGACNGRDVPQQHLALLSKQLEEQRQHRVDVLLGWRRLANRTSAAG
jgi:hypothetical protein